MKEKLERPEIEAIRFEKEDVISTSQVSTGLGGGQGATGFQPGPGFGPNLPTP